MMKEEGEEEEEKKKRKREEWDAEVVTGTYLNPLSLDLNCGVAGVALLEYVGMSYWPLGAD